MIRAADVRQLLRHEPFESFQIGVSDGTAYELRHPDMALVDRFTVTLALSRTEGPIPLAKREVIIAVLHIARLEVMVAA